MLPFALLKLMTSSLVLVTFKSSSSCRTTQSAPPRPQYDKSSSWIRPDKDVLSANLTITFPSSLLHNCHLLSPVFVRRVHNKRICRTKLSVNSGGSLTKTAKCDQIREATTWFLQQYLKFTTLTGLLPLDHKSPCRQTDKLVAIPVVDVVTM